MMPTVEYRAATVPLAHLFRSDMDEAATDTITLLLESAHASLEAYVKDISMLVSMTKLLVSTTPYFF